MKLSNSIILFEDKYGMYDLYRRSLKLSIVNEIKDVKLFSNNIYARCNMSLPRVLDISEVDIAAYKQLNISNIYIVHDLDNISGKKDSIMTQRQFRTYVRRNMSRGVYELFQVRYLPVIYAAESILIYLFYSCTNDVVTLVSSWNTNALHLAIVKHGLGIIEGGKNIDAYLSKIDIQGKLKANMKNAKCNKDILELVLGEDLSEIGFSYDTMVRLLPRISDMFNTRLQKCGDRYEINGRVYKFPKGSDCLIEC